MNVFVVQMLQYHSEMLGAVFDTEQAMSLKPGKTLSGAVWQKETNKLIMFPHCCRDNNRTVFQWFCWKNTGLNPVNEEGITHLPSFRFSIPEERFHMYSISVLLLPDNRDPGEQFLFLGRNNERKTKCSLATAWTGQLEGSLQRTSLNVDESPRNVH